MWYEQFKTFDREHELARHYARHFFVEARKLSHPAREETTVLRTNKRGSIERFEKHNVRAYDATRDRALAARYWRGVEAALKGGETSRLGNYIEAIHAHAIERDSFASTLRTLSASRDAKDFWLTVGRRHTNADKGALAFLKSRNVAGTPLVADATYHFEGTPAEMRFNRAGAIQYLKANGDPDAERTIAAATA